MKIAVLGAGAMGCLYGGSLAKAGNEVVFIDVVPKQIDAINGNGIRLTRDGETSVICAAAKRAEEVEGMFDLLILFTKTIHSRAALASVRHLLTDRTLVLSLQNGLGNEEMISEFVPRDRILIGMTGYPADLKGPGEVESNGSSFTKLMNADGKRTKDAEAVARAITEAGLNCSVDEDVYKAIWEKALFNAAVNPICAVTRFTVGEVRDFGGEELAFAVVREGAAVAKAKGIGVDEEAVKGMLRHAFTGHHDHRPSMLHDVLLGRKTEVEFINGAIVRYAKELGMGAPVNETLFRLVRMIEARPGGPDMGRQG